MASQWIRLAISAETADEWTNARGFPLPGVYRYTPGAPKPTAISSRPSPSKSATASAVLFREMDVRPGLELL